MGRWDSKNKKSNYNKFEMFLINLDKKVFAWLAMHGFKRAKDIDSGNGVSSE